MNVKTIYITTIIDMEPYREYEGGCGPAFTSEEAAKDFLEDHSEVYNAGYFRWDGDEIVSCSSIHPEAVYEYGWAYGSHIEEVTLYE